MGDLIQFRPSGHPKRVQTHEARPQAARVLFFTGVRYERAVPASPPPTIRGTSPNGGLDGTGGGRRKRRG